MPRRSRSDAKLELLKQVPLFSGCTNKELLKISSLCDEVEVDAGRVLAKEGSPGNEFFVILDGEAKVTLRKEELADLAKGTFFGEMSLLDREPRSVTVTAATPMRLLVLDAGSFHRFIRENPDVTVKILRGVAQRLRDLSHSPKY